MTCRLSESSTYGHSISTSGWTLLRVTSRGIREGKQWCGTCYRYQTVCSAQSTAGWPATHSAHDSTSGMHAVVRGVSYTCVTSTGLVHSCVLKPASLILPSGLGLKWTRIYKSNIRYPLSPHRLNSLKIGHLLLASSPVVVYEIVQYFSIFFLLSKLAETVRLLTCIQYISGLNVLWPGHHIFWDFRCFLRSFRRECQNIFK